MGARRHFRLPRTVKVIGPVALVIAAACSHAPKQHHWSYEGAEGPAKWAALSQEYAACRAGQYQSPVDIRAPSPARLARAQTRRALLLRMTSGAHAVQEVNNGHAIQVNDAGSDTLDILGARYSLVQYHFHAPSEHTIEGRRYPMEVHFVHQAPDGRLAVLAVMLEQGRTNLALEELRANAPRQKGGEVTLAYVETALGDLLPADRTAYRYEGSLTTPPCSEGVTWIVLTTPVEMGPGQIAGFRAAVRDNNRPIQPLNGRAIEMERLEAAR